MFYRSFLGTVLLSTLLVSGCATQPVAKDASPLGFESTPQQQLSDGNRTVITTSQGQISIEPTVVDMEGAETSSEVSAGDGNSIYYDPLESMNRAIFSFNHGAYKYLLIPIARGYKAIIPIQAREKIGNAFSNIREPLNLVSNLAAGNPKGAGTNLGRFLINTTIGLLGLFDPAKYWFDIEPAKQTIADTLSEHNIGNGA